MLTTPQDYRDAIAAFYRDRRWLVVGDVLASLTARVELLRELGATGAMCIAGSRGTGDLPAEDFVAHSIALGAKSDTIMGGIRASADALANLPADVQAKVDAFDPDRSAPVFSPFFSDGRPIGGRRIFGGRPIPWQALEDKTVIDAFWDEAGVTRAPYRIVDLQRDDVRAIAAALDRGAGTVWVGDNREGFHGGAEYARWVRDEAQARDALDFLGAHCDRARVMPFLNGIPCSIHGVVFPHATVALRPCEMLVYRIPGQAKLHYAGAATFWDPPQADRDAMRAMTRRVGDHLRATLGYRGFFTIDGVMTRDGFLPTELNPRFGAAANFLLSGMRELPLELLHLALIEGTPRPGHAPIDWRPEHLEQLIVTHADATRAGRGMALLPVPCDTPRKARLAFDPDTQTFHELHDDAMPEDATAFIGPSTMGTFLGARMNSERTPVGPSAAPRIGAALAWADQAWDLGLGPLEPAPELRAGASS